MDAPNITLTMEESVEVRSNRKKTVNFQCGLLRETETFVGEDVEMLCRDSLLDYISDILTIKVGLTCTK